MADALSPESVAPLATRVIDVDIHNGQVPTPHSHILTTGDGGRAPRKSRHINFTDDGKLFEGHLTVQSRNLKSVIQYLVDNQAEQTVIIKDLQDQVNTLRLKVAKANRGGYRGGGGGAGPMELEEMNKRLKALEGFVTLWGIRPEDVTELVQSYGDPVVTPDPYTSYLLDLPSFRLTRREARTMMASATQTRLSVDTVNAHMDTASRRAASKTRDEGGSQQPPQRPTDAAGPGEGADTVAQAALDAATEALRKVDALMLRSGGGRQSSGTSSAAAPPGDANEDGGFVDAEAREEIEELREYVAKKFKELEARSLMTSASAPRSSAGASPARSSSQRRPTSSSRERRTNSPPTQSAAAAPRVTPPLDEDYADAVAREDAALSLELVEELSQKVEKRFRELSNSIANIALRKGVAAPPSDDSGSPRRLSTPQGDAEQESATSARGKKQRGGASSKRTHRTPPTPDVEQASISNSIIHPVANSGVNAQAVERMVRDETAPLGDRLDDLEEELAKRWLALEERLRIIGRASMNKPNSPGSGGLSIDRKAREDASLSLMRVQHLERELAMLKRQLSANPGATTGPGASAADGPGGSDAADGYSPLLPAEGLKDTYGSSRMQDLEKEVEQRMAEVNRAIAMLKGFGDEKQHQSLLDLLAGHPLLGLEPSASGDGHGTVVLTSHEADPTEGPPPLDATSTVVLQSIDPDSTAAPHRGPAGTAPRVTPGMPPGLGTSGVFPDEAMLPVRFTVSRLRSPNARTFGSRLVERDVVVEADTARWPVKNAKGALVQADASPSAAEALRDADQIDDAHTLPLSAAPVLEPTQPLLPPLKDSVSGRPKPQGASMTSATTAGALHVQHDVRSSLGHSKPCVVLNCAWCAAEKSQQVQQAAAARSR